MSFVSIEPRVGGSGPADVIIMSTRTTAILHEPSILHDSFSLGSTDLDDLQGTGVHGTVIVTLTHVSDFLWSQERDIADIQILKRLYGELGFK